MQLNPLGDPPLGAMCSVAKIGNHFMGVVRMGSLVFSLVVLFGLRKCWVGQKSPADRTSGPRCSLYAGEPQSNVAMPALRRLKGVKQIGQMWRRYWRHLLFRFIPAIPQDMRMSYCMSHDGRNSNYRSEVEQAWRTHQILPMHQNH